MKVGDVIQFSTVDSGPNKDDKWIVWHATVIEIHTYDTGVVDDDRIWEVSLLFEDGTLRRQKVSELEFEVINEKKI